MSVSSIAAKTRSKLFETRRIQLTSPLFHIGGVISQLSPFEYVKTGDRVYLPNLDALMSGIQQVGRMEEYVSLVKSRKPIVNFLRSVFGEDWNQATGREGELIFPPRMSSLVWGNCESIGDLRPMIRDGFGRLYIPGTSIKGAIRTAIAYHMVKQNAAKSSDIESRLRQLLDNRRINSPNSTASKFTNNFSGKVMEELFAGFVLNARGKRITGAHSANTDFMRVVHLSDSAPLLPQDGFNLAIVTEVIACSYTRANGNQVKKRASIWPELVQSVKTPFTLGLDPEMLSWFEQPQGRKIPFQSIADLLVICREFAQAQWSYDRAYWQSKSSNLDDKLDISDIQRFYEPEACPYDLRIGWGCGLSGTTIQRGLQGPDVGQLTMDLRNACWSKHRSDYEAPKSRRVAVGPSGRLAFPLGWVKFERVV
jgi:CRISPR-associated protein Csm5